MSMMEILNEAAMPVGSVAAAVTAVGAWWGIHRTASDNREKAQPFVLAEFATAPHSDISIQLVIKNVGVTPARNVQVTFDPPLPPGEVDSAIWRLHERYDDPIAVLGPGQQFSNNWWLSDYTLENPSLRNVYDLPRETTVTIKYRGIGKGVFEESFPISSWLVLLDSSPVASDSKLGSLRRIATTAGQLAQLVPGVLRRIEREEDAD
ncbi:hypothetical protein [Brevibacterium sp. UBA7493]|uniref:hypothetical protein n=1 Tax=Brevibacterium sp. UBA7493 TaxID=1946121 RepID=UPI002580690D|nr:hypothetical protein [Brevibacterium sp. UBA7493]